MGKGNTRQRELQVQRPWGGNMFGVIEEQAGGIGEYWSSMKGLGWGMKLVRDGISEVEKDPIM